MFGYVLPFKPMLRVCEYEGYRSIYCGVCKTIAREFGTLPRFTLSYDMTFLALMDMSVNEVTLTAQQQRCIAHPMKKRSCADCEGLEYSAYASIILLYHKLCDDREDGNLKEKAISGTARTAFAGAYIKARKKYPRLAHAVEKEMQLQYRLEREGCRDIDRACEPTARIMQAVFRELSADKEQSKRLGAFGYFLGRYVYLADALDDLREDARKGNYNAVASALRLSGEISEEQYKNACEYVSMTANLTLGQLAEEYVKLPVTYYKSIIDNVIYLGLKNVLEQIKTGTFRKLRKGRSSTI